MRELYLVVHAGLIRWDRGLITNYVMETMKVTCPEYDAAEGKCKVDGFKFYSGMNKPCDTPGITKDKCPRFAMK
ncbi:MAG: hypothetical protein DRO87_10700 [Candidatus Thorarchaeota archaeon]|nr:MAG: hypothetical protein DRO87_10700 [Candidatus Thorarchaeota archaeon]RLI56887.1 MAG: hypothetical protein DRP09_04995 [Candidatus Thorarchaeota archaeon]